MKVGSGHKVAQSDLQLATRKSSPQLKSKPFTPAVSLCDSSTFSFKDLPQVGPGLSFECVGLLPCPGDISSVREGTLSVSSLLAGQHLAQLLAGSKS